MSGEKTEYSSKPVGSSTNSESGGAAPYSGPVAATRTKIIAASTGLIAFVLFCLTPFLPVNQVQSSLNWPQNNNVDSVLAPLMSYSPETMDMTVPLNLANELNEDQTDIVSTLPYNFPTINSRGMSVRKIDEGIDVVSRNRVIFEIDQSTLKSLPSNATLKLHFDSSEVQASVVGATDSKGKPLEKTTQSDLRPQVTGVFTEIKSSAAQSAIQDGLHVHMQIDSRYTSSPTIAKYACMFLGVILALISLVALHRLDILDGHKVHRFLPRNWWKFKPLDAIVGFILLFWYFIGANTSDDGYLLTMARVSEHAGYMANYYRWFGVPESPFGAPYYDLLGLMARVSTTSTWMRLPELIASALTWMLLSREVIPRLGPKMAGRRVAYWTAAFVFLALWMAYNNGLRPEPVIALGALLTWVCFERAIATGRLLPAAIGVIVASISLAAGPTGLMAVASLLAALSGIFRIMVRRLPLLGTPKGSSRKAVVGAVITQVAPFLAAGTAILTAVFGDQTLRTVMESIKLRSFIGPSLHWYEESTRYEALLGEGVDGSFPRRFAVIMVMVGLVTVLATLLRNRKVPGAAVGPTQRLVLAMIGTIFFMAFTPTKWTHHFGVYAGIGAAVAALAAVAASHLAMSSVRNRYIYLGGVLFLFALSLAGFNAWWYVSSLGVAWWDKPVQFHQIQASSVMLAISLAVMAFGVVQSFRKDIAETLASSESESKEVAAKESARARRFAGVAASPIAVLCIVVVVFNCASLAKGFIKQYPAYSVGLGNLRTLAGHDCQMADYIDVEKKPSDNMLKTADGSPIGNSLTAGGNQNFGPNNIPATIVYNDDDPSASSISTVGQQADSTDSSGSSSSSSSTGSSNSSSQSNSSHNSSGNAATSGSTGSTNSGSSSSSSSNSGSSGSNSSSSQNSDATADQASGQGATSTSTNSAGTEGGSSKERGINGSAAWLPFGLDPKKVPVIGSYTSDLQVPSEVTTAWYALTDRNSPIISVSAAGRIKHLDINGVPQPGQTLVLEYGHRDANGSTTMQGSFTPLDPGPTPLWRNLRFKMSDIPADANVVRIHATDTDLAKNQWLAFTPPRIPQMESLNSYVGSTDPVMLDWVVALQFPCQRPFDHYAGVAEVPKYRITPDYSSKVINSLWQDYLGGGALGLVDSSTIPLELPTYFRDDWSRDWGELDVLMPLTNSEGDEIKPAHIDEKTVERSGLWYPGPMNYKNQTKN